MLRASRLRQLRCMKSSTGRNTGICSKASASDPRNERWRAHEAARAQQAGSHQRDGSSIVTKVLYVEDNDDNVFMLKMRLELLGDFEVLTAEDGEKGCTMALSERPDIILRRSNRWRGR